MSKKKPLAAPLFVDDVSVCMVMTFRQSLEFVINSKISLSSLFLVYSTLNRLSNRTDIERYFHVQNRKVLARNLYEMYDRWSLANTAINVDPSEFGTSPGLATLIVVETTREGLEPGNVTV